MNYIREINAFYDWLETNSISDSAIVLWHALMHINNKAGWITEFAVAISTLETKTGMKKDAIIRARHRLQQVGRITFKSRNGQQSAVYSIVPFIGTSSDCVGLNDTNSDTNRNTNRELTATQTATQTASINKLNINETKPEKDIIPYREIISALNEATGASYKSSTKKNQELIQARWNEGFRLPDFSTVIRKKVAQWKGTENEQYLRPLTLFGTKFESYLNQPEPKKHGQALGGEEIDFGFHKV